LSLCLTTSLGVHFVAGTRSSRLTICQVHLQGPPGTYNFEVPADSEWPPELHGMKLGNKCISISNAGAPTQSTGADLEVIRCLRGAPELKACSLGHAFRHIRRNGISSQSTGRSLRPCSPATTATWC
jgi:hypothetical protein